MDHNGGPSAFVPTAIVATWPKGSFAENIAVDPEGVVFVSLHTDRAIDRYDPATGVLARFAELETPVAGLVFGSDGGLYVSGGQPGQAPGVIWRVDRGGIVARVADLPEALFLNGMTLHPDGRRLLVVDSIRGLVEAVDPSSGTVETWLSDPRLRAVAGDFTPGVNGIKIFGGFVFLSITRSDCLVRAALHADGSPGELQTVAERLRADDFAVAADGTLLIATHPARSLVRLAPDGTRQTVAAAEHGMTGATAVAFGRTARDSRSVYVTTTGGTMTLPPEELEPAKLVRVDLG